MTMTRFMVVELATTVERWGRALITLPAADLERQRLDLVQQAEAQIGASPAALILQQVDAELARQNILRREQLRIEQRRRDERQVRQVEKTE